MRVLGVALATTLAVIGCGARTGLDFGASPPQTRFVAAGGGGAGRGGAASNGGASTTGGAGGGAALEDVCSSAISGPRAMWKSCATRDGRARVLAPKAPHVVWTKQLPTYGDAHLDVLRVATDASDNAYVITTASFSDMGDLRRVRAADGTIDWTTPLVPDSASGGVPVIRPGAALVFAYGPGSQPSIFGVDPPTGALTQTTFGFDLYDAAGDPAIGEDGSLYLTHSTGVGTANPATFVSRVRPDGTVAWTSTSLAKLAPTLGPDDVGPSLIALGGDGLVVLTVTAVPKTGIQTVALALDAATGAVRWVTLGLPQVLGGPAIRADGKVVMVAAAAGATSVPNLVLVDPAGAPSSSIGLGVAANQLFAVGRDGSTVVGTTAVGNGLGGLAALGPTGTTLWQTTSIAVRDATIAADGTIVAFGQSTITALDPATGSVNWSLAAPHPQSYIGDLALTSSGGIVAVQGDGTLFGVGD